MKRSIKSVIGVTLLEIMLVLAIASMIVVMSIRYYQSASNSQQANAALQQVQAVIAAMDSLGIAGGYGGVTSSQLTAVLGSSNMITPNKGAIALGTKTTSTYEVTFGLTAQTCPNVLAKLTSNPKSAGSKCAAGVLTLTYDATK